MSDEYTPTMDEIVERASSSVYESQRRLRAEALRAIAAHDRALREQIAQDIESIIEGVITREIADGIPQHPYHNGGLRRAAQIVRREWSA